VCVCVCVCVCLGVAQMFERVSTLLHPFRDITFDVFGHASEQANENKIMWDGMMQTFEEQVTALQCSVCAQCVLSACSTQLLLPYCAPVEPYWVAVLHAKPNLRQVFQVKACKT
jgi:hypothetical protein